MKLKRMLEWWRVVKVEAQIDGLAWWQWEHGDVDRLSGLIARMVKVVVFGEGVVDRARWRARIRFGCGRCPVYDRSGRKCRLLAGGRAYGCGCYVPFLALVPRPYAKGCWWREHVGPDGGWV